MANIIVNKINSKYNIGDVFFRGEDFWMLTKIDYDEYCLVNFNGITWAEPMSFACLIDQIESENFVYMGSVEISISKKS